MASFVGTLCHNCVVQVEKDVFRLIKLAETKAHSGDVKSPDGIKVSALAAAAAYSSALFLVGVRRVCLFEVKLVQAGHGALDSQLVANSKASRLLAHHQSKALCNIFKP